MLRPAAHRISEGPPLGMCLQADALSESDMDDSWRRFARRADIALWLTVQALLPDPVNQQRRCAVSVLMISGWQRLAIVVETVRPCLRYGMDDIQTMRIALNLIGLRNQDMSDPFTIFYDFVFTSSLYEHSYRERALDWLKQNIGMKKAGKVSLTGSSIRFLPSLIARESSAID